MELFGVGAAEALVVLVITMIVVGPQRFPEIARQGGRYYRIARRYAAEVTADVRGAMAELESEIETQKDELQEAQREISGQMRETVDATRGELREMESDARSAVDGAARDAQAAPPTLPTAPSAPDAKPAAPRATSAPPLRAPRELPAGSPAPEDD